MMTERFAKEQLRRISGMAGFPKDAKAVEELVRALMICESDALGEHVITELLQSATAGQPCPYAADLRRLAYDENGRRKTKRVNCSACGGTGIITAWYLVTYKSSALNIARAEPIVKPASRQISDYEYAMEVAQQLAEKKTEGFNPQGVISAAADCVCRRMAA